MAKEIDFSDIATKVKTYEDVAEYFAEYKNRCYEDEINEFIMIESDPMTPEELAKEACFMTITRFIGRDNWKDEDHEMIRAVNDRLDRALERLRALEDEN